MEACLCMSVCLSHATTPTIRGPIVLIFDAGTQGKPLILDLGEEKFKGKCHKLNLTVHIRSSILLLYTSFLCLF